MEPTTPSAHDGSNHDDHADDNGQPVVSPQGPAKTDLPPESAADEVEPAAEIACPSCGQVVDPPQEGAGPFLVCPACGEQFVIAAEEETQAEEDEAAEDAGRNDEIDALRVRQFSAARRSALRARTYYIAAILGCLTSACELVRKTIVCVRAQGFGLRAIGFVFGAAALWMAARFFIRRAYAITEELQKPLLQDPETPPDFTSLGDGSQQLRNLEQLAGKQDGEEEPPAEDDQPEDPQTPNEQVPPP